MPRKVILLLAFGVAFVCGAFLWRQQYSVRKLEARVSSLIGDVREKEAELARQREVTARLKEENNAYRDEASTLREKLAARHEVSGVSAADVQTATAPIRKRTKTGELFRGAAKDPKVQEAMREQFDLMTRQQWSDFVKEQHLSPQLAEQFFGLLHEKQKDLDDDQITGFYDDETNAPDKEASPAVPNRTAEADRQLQMLLGQGGYAAYQDYGKSVEGRRRLTDMRQEIAVDSTPVSDEQSRMLLQVVVEENANTPYSPLQYGSTGRGKAEALREEGAADDFLQAQADLGDRIRQRVGNILTPDQLRALEIYQKKENASLRFGLEMMRKMLGDPDVGGEAAPPPQP